MPRADLSRREGALRKLELMTSVQSPSEKSMLHQLRVGVPIELGKHGGHRNDKEVVQRNTREASREKEIRSIMYLHSPSRHIFK